MKGFLLGLLVAAAGFGGFLLWKQRTGPAVPIPVTADAGVEIRPAKAKKRRKRGAQLARNVGNSGGRADVAPAVDPEPEPMKLSAADLKTVGQGDDLSRPDVLRLDMSDDSGTRELSQDEIDARFRSKETAILDCISRARPDEDTYVPGRVTIKFRIQRAGTVRGVRVEGPAILMKGGLYGCVKGVLNGLRFPPSNSSQILSYPFSLS